MVQQDGAAAIRGTAASIRYGEDERTSHDESSAGTACGSIGSMVIIEPT